MARLKTRAPSELMFSLFALIIFVIAVHSVYVTVIRPKAAAVLAAVVLAALDDAIADDKKYGNGPDQIARWARSRDGREVLSCAGIDPNERVVKGLMEFVSKGVRTSVALSREESERRHAAEEAAEAA